MGAADDHKACTREYSYLTGSYKHLLHDAGSGDDAAPHLKAEPSPDPGGCGW